MPGTRVLIALVLSACVMSVTPSVNSLKCDSKCKCEKNGTDVIVTCTGKGLRSLPLHIPEDVTVLRVGGNKIRDLPNDSLQRFSKLRELDLSYMVDVEYQSFTLNLNSFQGLKYLKVLNMTKIAYSLDIGCNSRPFRHTKSLQELNMGMVRARNLSCLNTALHDVRQLKRLSFMVSHTIPPSLALMKNLAVLDLTGSDFQSMNQESFSVLRNISLKVLSLRGVQFDTVDPLALLPVAHSLQALDYSCPGTKNTNPDLFAPILPSFQNSTALRVLNLDGVYQHTDECLKLQDKQFEPLHRVPLVSLSIRDNSITTVRKFWSYIRSGKYLNLNYNPISLQHTKQGGLMTIFLIFTKFQTLYLSYLTQANTPSVCSSDVNWEFWEQVESAEQQKADEKMGIADSTNNKLKFKLNVENFIFSHTDYLTSDSIKNGPYNVSDLDCGLERRCNIDASSLTRLDLSYVNWFRFLSPIYGLNSVKYLNFEHCNLEFVHPKFFRAFPSLQTLRLAGNRFGLFTNESLLAAVFSNLPNVRKIDLSANLLTTVPRAMFSNCTSLVFLNLRNNPLITFNFDFSLFPQLSFVDLGDCKIQEFKNYQIDFFKTSSSLKVNVTGLTELNCNNCNNKDFYEMIRKNKSLVQLGGREGLTCRYTSDGERVQLVALDLSRLEFNCMYEIFIIACVAVVFVVLVSVVVVLYCRWNIKYLVYLTKMKLRTRGNRHAKFFEYDLYLSFSEDDRDTAFQLFTGLHNKGLDVFYWPRNSRPGTCQFEEIFEQLDRSKKIVVLITSSTETSVTQNFEIRMSLARGKGFIIPVVTEEFVVGKLPGPIKNLLRHDLYFPWPEQEEDQKEFWRSLERAVRTKGGVRFQRNGCVAYYGK